MREIALADFCEEKSQGKAAEIIGCSQSAVSQMIRSNRMIFIIDHGDGTYGCKEIKIPKAKKAA